MVCGTCGRDLPADTTACTTCGSIGLCFTIAPREVIEFGVVTSLVFGILGALLVLLGMIGLRGAVWLGADLGAMLIAGGFVSVFATVPMLFVTSLVALRMLERARYVFGPAADHQAAAALHSNLASCLVGYELTPPASVVEHTTLRLVVSDTATNKVPAHG